ncbi:prolyl oligopeptidase family serine peptidase [Natronogracilivirgula saccharolytica]|uniref:Prolyl oligopeptidase family serine peptidase n=2 Tax=Natronogracilivirga saccharolytica TaxID=2812953 RepID=A0A8J7RQK9_9BACT|nr:prolyl oligopeptidase family serine peptidase [Natronogracilivirga saccharolytica]
MTYAETDDELKRISYQSRATGEVREFFLYLPEGYRENADVDAGSDKWPVMLFLHGNGERGDGKDELDFVMMHGPLYEAWVQKRDLPFIIISPQLPMYGMDELDYIANRDASDIPRRQADGVPDRQQPSVPDYPMNGVGSPDEMSYPTQGPPDGWYRLEDDLLDILDMVLETYQADPGRVYITGISYGGFGTWYMAENHPGRFAAMAPVVGYGHPDAVSDIAEYRIPVWCFSGGRDAVVEPHYFYPAMNKLQELGHDSIRLTNHEDMGHDVWRRVYAGRDIYDWLLSHSR